MSADENCRSKENDDDKDDDTLAQKKSALTVCTRAKISGETMNETKSLTEKDCRSSSTTFFPPSCFDASDKSYII